MGGDVLPGNRMCRTFELFVFHFLILTRMNLRTFSVRNQSRGFSLTFRPFSLKQSNGVVQFIVPIDVRTPPLTEWSQSISMIGGMQRI